MTILPSAGKARFLISDDIREEVSNKFTIMGLYPSNNVVLPSSVNLPGLIASLAILWTFQDGSGEFKVSFKMIGPNGRDAIPPPEPITAHKTAVGDMNFVVKYIGFPVTEFGTYTNIVMLNAQKYEGHFVISSGA